MSVYSYDDFPDMINRSLLVLGGSVLGVILLIVLLFSSLIGVAFYVVRAMGLYRIAQARGNENAWLAWVPIANGFLLGWVGDDIVEKSGRKSWNMRWWILGGLACTLVTWIPAIGWLLTLGTIAALVIEYFALFEIYQRYAPDNKVIYLVLSIFFSSICTPIFLFLLGRKAARE
ncbi:MAG: hypothetical protein PHO66_01345 [Eubacteriales bacterium]|nr:hypothetical protein [Eubacteriales bacterium]